jgi:hypothetical protein
MGARVISHLEFVSQAEDFLRNNGTNLSAVFDAEVAFQTYAADPQPWHVVSENNPTGDPVVGMITAEGSWWTVD